MANRHLARSVVLQVIFEKDATNGGMLLEQAFARLNEYAREFGTRESDLAFMKDILQTEISKEKEIDAVIAKAAPEWPLDRIAAIDRAILRLGLTELLYADRTQVPAKVAINEAIELAKGFGGASSSKFVNGVLGAVYVDIGEPGKAEGVQRKEESWTKTVPVEELVGAVVYARDGQEIYFAVVHDIFGHWTLSKGKLAEGEDREAAVKRKVLEEVGLAVTVEEMLGENEYVATDSTSGGGKKKRHATYYLAQSEFKDLYLKREGGLDDAQWFPVTAVGDLNFYDDVLPVVMRALTIIAKRR